MFVYVLFLVGILCTLATFVLGETVYIVKQTEHNQAARYAQLIAEQSTALYMRQARAQVSGGGVGALTTGPWSMSGSSCDASVTNCPYTYSAQALVAAGTGTGVSGNAQAPNDSAMNLQRSYLNEQRASVKLQIAINDKNNKVVAGVMRSLTLRLFNADPWVIISGNKQYDAHSVNDTSPQGDTGGMPAQPGDFPAPDPNQPGRYHDTRVHVTIQCVNDGPGGGRYGNEKTGGIQVSCAGAPSPGPADSFNPSPQPWHNVGGDGNPKNWSQ